MSVCRLSGSYLRTRTNGGRSGFIFEGFETAAQPVTIWIVVPGGTSTTVQVPMGASRYEWTANVPGGTSVMFFMTDARGGQGGASDVRTASRSDDRSCLDDQALSSTMTSSTAASTPTSSTEDSRTASPTTEPSESAAATAAASVPISAIAGTVIGSLLFLAVIVTLGLFFLKNFKKKHDRMKDAKRRSGATAYSQDPYGNSYRPPSYGPSSTNLVSGENPFADSTSNIHSAYANYSSSDPFQSRPAYPPSPALPTPSSSDPFNPSAPPILPPTHMNDGRPTSPTERSQGTSMTSAQRKAAMAGETSHKPQRFIVHTDLEDALPPPSEDEVVELPPMYTERRGPSNFTVANTTPEDLPPPPSATHTYSFSQPNRSQPFS
ncbi:hypothetical protein CC2G_001198 [Coprinopsis cinerea AmutBmut pab1-1]|nr:hypothetical protein CC2G_001198 [Coprinopsis cinerea AmutBmut pab1-1]